MFLTSDLSSATDYHMSDILTPMLMFTGKHGQAYCVCTGRGGDDMPVLCTKDRNQHCPSTRSYINQGKKLICP